MSLEGRTCGDCNRGKLHSVQDQVQPGVFVDAYKCNLCKSIAYTEEVMKRVEALYREQAQPRSLIKIGSSLAISVPKAIVQRLRLKPKERVYVRSDGNEIIVRVAPG